MNLNEMTVSQLRELASELDIYGRSKMKKAELIAAIEYAEAPSADNIPGGIDDHATAVARMRANIDAEEEERAAARRARNRTNYAPATEPAEPSVYEDPAVRAAIRETVAEQAAYIEEGIEADEQADAEAGDLLDAALGEYVEPTGSTGQIAITKYSAHEAMATAAFEDGSTVGAHITRGRGGRWALMYGSGHVIRAKTLGKVAKLWAKRLRFHAAVIDVETMN